MLSIGKLSAGQASYYLDQAEVRVDAVTSIGGGLEDYYVGSGEARGVWVGRGAAALGLGGEVDGDALRRVLAGCDPFSSESLRRSSSPVRVAGFDLTSSAPKSVSVVFGVADERVRATVRTAHDRAVREALAYLERSAAAVRRGHGGVRVEQADGLVAAAFRHRTSRAGDPQLHTHVLVANLGRGPDGRWSALDGRQLYAHARAASFLYQAVLRSELSRELGVGWGGTRRGIAELAGVPKRVRVEFSRRRAEIEAALAEHGTSGARAAEAAALATRRAKRRGVDATSLTAEWRERAAAAGFNRADLERMLGRARAVRREVSWESVFDELAGRLGVTRRASTFSRRDVIQALCERVRPVSRLTLTRCCGRRVDSARPSALSRCSPKPVWRSGAAMGGCCRFNASSLPEIQAGGLFSALADRLGAIELTQVRRQHEAWDRDALAALRDGDLDHFARAYYSHAAGSWRRPAPMRRGRRSWTIGGLRPSARAFAVGDRVVTTRNDGGLGVVNGESGTLTRISQGALTVELDRGARVELPESYASNGRLDHGYATTAHRAQGATVDRAFVLGSDELYREWGYTALSRHREAARFYVTATPAFLNAAPEPLLDADLPHRVARMLESSRAEHLALHGVIQGELRPLLREQIEQAASNVGDIVNAIERLGAQRAGTRWYERGRRAEIDRAVADDRIARNRWQHEHDRLVAELAERPGLYRPELCRARDPLARLDPAAELGRERARQRSRARKDDLGRSLGR